MKLNVLFAIAFFWVSAIAFSQEVSESMPQTENELLYNTAWKLNKSTPEFDNSIGIVLEFDKAGKQLKVVREILSTPKLQGTKLVTTKKEDVNVYSWKFGALETIYEGDNVVSKSLDYSKIELFAEGYEFKILSVTATALKLQVIKAPKVIFGKSIFGVRELLFVKQ